MRWISFITYLVLDRNNCSNTDLYYIIFHFKFSTRTIETTIKTQVGLLHTTYTIHAISAHLLPVGIPVIWSDCDFWVSWTKYIVINWFPKVKWQSINRSWHISTTPNATNFFDHFQTYTAIYYGHFELSCEEKSKFEFEEKKVQFITKKGSLQAFLPWKRNFQ